MEPASAFAGNLRAPWPIYSSSCCPVASRALVAPRGNIDSLLQFLRSTSIVKDQVNEEGHFSQSNRAIY